MGLFDSEKKEAIRRFLEYTEERLRLGQSIPEIIQNYNKNFAPKILKKSLKSILQDMKKGKTFAQALFKQKYIIELHKNMLDSAGRNISFAINRIIESFDSQTSSIKEYVWTIVKIQATFLTFISIGTNLGAFQKVITAMAINKDKALANVPIYYQDPIYFLSAGIIPNIIILLIVLYYITYRNSNPKLIYKIDKVTQYNDALYIFNTLKSLVEVGISLQDSFLRLQKITKNKMLKRLFRNIYNSFENGKPMLVNQFRKYNFNAFVWERLEAIEQGGNVLDNLNGAIKLLKKEKEKEIKRTEDKLKVFVMAFNMIILSFVGMDMFMHQMDAMIDV